MKQVAIETDRSKGVSLRQMADGSRWVESPEMTSEKLLKLAAGTLKGELRQAGVEWNSVDEQNDASNLGVDVRGFRKQDIQAAIISLARHIANGNHSATFSRVPPHGDSIHADLRDTGMRLVVEELSGKPMLRFDVMVKAA